MSLFDAILPSIGTRVMKINVLSRIETSDRIKIARASNGCSNSHAFPDLTLCDDLF